MFAASRRHSRVNYTVRYPAQSRSTWLPLGSSPADIEQCLGQNGLSYVWLVSTTNVGYRYQPL